MNWRYIYIGKDGKVKRNTRLPPEEFVDVSVYAPPSLWQSNDDVIKHYLEKVGYYQESVQ